MLNTMNSRMIKNKVELAVPAKVFREHEVVRAITNIENEGEKVAKGTEGTVVSVYRNGEAYAVEFVAQASMVVVTVYANQLEAVWRLLPQVGIPR